MKSTYSESIAKITLNARLKSPLHIGMGEGHKLFPFIDYLWDKDGKYGLYLDMQLLNELLIERKGKVTDYVELLLDFDGKPEEKMDTIRTFLEETLDLSLSSESDLVKRAIPYIGLDHGKGKEIHPMISSLSHPYIPGSSVKGAIMNAFQFYWFEHTDEGKHLMEELIGLLKDFEEDARELEPLARLARRKGGLNDQMDDEQRFKDLKKGSLKIMDEIRSCFDHTRFFKFPLGENQRRRKNDSWDSAQFFRFEDSEQISKNALRIYEVKRVSLTEEKVKAGIPVLVEGLIPETQIDLNINLRIEDIIDQNRSNFATMLDDDFTDWKIQLISWMAPYYEACIEHEYDQLLRLFESAFGPKKDHIKLHLDFYDHLDKDNACYIRLGWGKRWLDNSLALAVYRRDKTAFSVYQNLVKKVPFDQDHYPKGRFITEMGNLPMGWIELS